MSEMNSIETTGSQPELNTVQRIIGVFFSPKNTFEDIDRKPGWVVPLILILIIMIASTFITMKYGISERMETQREMMQDRGMTDDQIAMAEKVGKIIGPIWAAIITGVMLAIFTLILWFVGNIVLGGQTTFSRIFSVYNYSFLIGMLGVVLSIPLIISKQTANVHFSLALLLPEDQSKTLLYNVLKAFGLFSIWQYVVLAIGFAVIYKFSMKKAAVPIFILFLFVSAISVAVSQLFPQ